MADAPQQLGDHRQVSGSELTLSEAIRQGDVPKSALMGWNEWQQWRSQFGRVPTHAPDGFVLPTQIETSLWRATMNELYGEDWVTIRTLQEADEGRHVSARRLREAEARREELLGTRAPPRLQDALPASPEAMPPVATENTPDSESPDRAEEEPPRTPTARAQPTEVPARPRPTGAVASPVSSESPGADVSNPTTIGKKALQPHDAS